MKEKKGELIQHFFGINIVVADNTFNEKKLTAMHFTEENNILHFIYILPFSQNRRSLNPRFSKEVLKVLVQR